MDKFRVGQRVRVLRSTYFPELVGEIVTITEQRKYREPAYANDAAWRGYGTDVEQKFIPGLMQKMRFCPREEQLAPVDDGWEKTTWDQCVWHPQRITHTYSAWVGCPTNYTIK